MAPTALIHLKSRALALPALRMALDAHDTDPAPEPTGDPAPQPDPKPADPKPADPASAKETDPKPVPGPRKAAEDGDLGDAGQKALSTEREARKAAEREAREAKAAREAAERKVQEFEDAKKTELERAQAAAERAAEREATANRRAVTSDLRSAAIQAEAADPGIVVELLSRDLDKYLTDGGIDTDAIDKAVADLLEAKPLLKKVSPPAPVTAPPATPKPAPDPGQGNQRGAAAKDFMKATDDEVDDELASMGIRRRR